MTRYIRYAIFIWCNRICCDTVRVEVIFFKCQIIAIVSAHKTYKSPKKCKWCANYVFTVTMKPLESRPFVARVCASSLVGPSLEYGILHFSSCEFQHLCSFWVVKLNVVLHSLAAGRYWICAFCVNQHKGICHPSFPLYDSATGTRQRRLLLSPMNQHGENPCCRCNGEALRMQLPQVFEHRSSMWERSEPEGWSGRKGRFQLVVKKFKMAEKVQKAHERTIHCRTERKK